MHGPEQSHARGSSKLLRSIPESDRHRSAHLQYTGRSTVITVEATSCRGPSLRSVRHQTAHLPYTGRGHSQPFMWKRQAVESHPVEVLALEWRAFSTQAGAQTCPWKLQAVEVHPLEVLAIKRRTVNTPEHSHARGSSKLSRPVPQKSSRSKGAPSIHRPGHSHAIP